LDQGGATKNAKSPLRFPRRAPPKVYSGNGCAATPFDVKDITDALKTTENAMLSFDPCAKVNSQKH
jgi:hypothetical protein